MKTAELAGTALDWAVANCVSKLNGLGGYVEEFIVHPFSTDWAQGGPIIEREGINVNLDEGVGFGERAWISDMGGREFHGPTPLIAAMRCYVASKLGNDVKVPNELTGGKLP